MYSAVLKGVKGFNTHLLSSKAFTDALLPLAYKMQLPSSSPLPRSALGRPRNECVHDHLHITKLLLSRMHHICCGHWLDLREIKKSETTTVIIIIVITQLSCTLLRKTKLLLFK